MPYKNKKDKHKNTIKWMKNNPKRLSEIRKRSNIKKCYGITLEQRDEMVIFQNRRCAICKNLFENEFEINIDHDHKTGKIRGILCRKCNTGLGFMRDNIDILKSAIEYLKKTTSDYVVR